MRFKLMFNALVIVVLATVIAHAVAVEAAIAKCGHFGKTFPLDEVTVPIHVYQTNGGHSGDEPSTLQFSNLTLSDWTGTSQRPTRTSSPSPASSYCSFTAPSLITVVDVECSPAVPCPNIRFHDINVALPNGIAPSYECVNVASEFELPACNATVTA
ncbi:glycoside hydrolase family 28 protein [Trametes sanguinea]|nr:glycoside hydrolase family 28 protein [Trametes sanguinea]